jgi:Kef-type K+ transport system membrane component KefB
MMSRGEVGLIVASVGVAEGAIPNSTFSAVVGVVIVTTLLTPPLLRLSFRKTSPDPSGGSGTASVRDQKTIQGETS